MLSAGVSSCILESFSDINFWAAFEVTTQEIKSINVSLNDYLLKESLDFSSIKMCIRDLDSINTAFWEEVRSSCNDFIDRMKLIFPKLKEWFPNDPPYSLDFHINGEEITPKKVKTKTNAIDDNLK